MKRRNRADYVRRSTLLCGWFNSVLDNSRCMAQPVMSRARVPAATTATPAGSVLSAIAPLSGAADLDEFPGRRAEAAAGGLGTRQAFAILCDRSTGRPQLASLCSPAHTPPVSGFLQNYRAPQPGLGTAAPSTNVITGPGLWMVPVSHDSYIEALVGVVSPSANDPALDQMEPLLGFSPVAGPLAPAWRVARRFGRKREIVRRWPGLLASRLRPPRGGRPGGRRRQSSFCAALPKK